MATLFGGSGTIGGLPTGDSGDEAAPSPLTTTDPAKLLAPEAEAPQPAAPIRAATALPTDPLLAQQWHLGNTGGLLDLRVQGVWNPASGAAYTGAGTRIVVIDDGFDYNHADLAAPYDDGLDFDFDEVDLDPFGAADDSHGTAVAGIIGADDNGTGVVGVAFDSSLVGYRTHGFITDFWLQNIRDAIHHAAVSAMGDVANISQSIANDENSEFGAGYNAVRFDEIETSIGDAVSLGRGGLGMTIVKSAGNSRADDYDVNADDWSNDTRQVVVAAVDQNGFVSSYSSYGAALLVSAFGTPGQVLTTDRTGAAGYNGTDFTYGFNGTSAAAPMISGVVSLLYDANPGLGWRDVQSILALTARQVGSEVGAGTAGSERYAWQFNAAGTWNGGGLHFSNDYGYGLVDALAAVRLAETWLDTTAAQTNGNQFTNTMDMLNAVVVIPDGNATGFYFSGTAGFDDEVERVTVTLTFSTTWLADLELYVISPDGTVSELINDVAGSEDFSGTWTFETQAFRGERAAGTWTVRIVDDAGGDILTVSDIVLRTFGRFSSDDRYVFTNEFSDYAGIYGHATTITDSNGGIDAINASAVTLASQINLAPGALSNIDGVTIAIGATTQIEHAYGGDGNDWLRGNAVGNRLLGGRGNDSLDGGDGTDSLYGGAGDDTLSQNFGGPDEVMDGGADTDTGDWSYSLFNAWTIDLAAGTAKIGATTYAQLTSIENAVGGQAGDTIIGTSGANRLDGQNGADSIDGGSGDDSLYGGAGNDTLSQNTGSGTEIMDGGADSDTGDWSYNNFGFAWTIDLAAGTAVSTGITYATLVSIENVIGTQNADTIVGTSGANRLDGQNGADFLDGGSGDDSLYGGAGNDTLSQNTGSGTEIMDGGADSDTGDWSYNNFGFAWTIDLAAGTAVSTGITYATLVSIENVIGTQNADTIVGTSGANRLDGQNGADFLDGGDGTDSLYGGAGDDTLSQNFGGPDEVMDGGADTDTGDWSYSLFNAWTIDLAAGTAKIGATTYAQLISIENAIGGQAGDTIIGTSGANRLDGQNGADFLDGGSGTDSLYGGAGNDTLSQNTGSGTEIMDGGADTDTGDWSYNNFGSPWTIDLVAGTAVANGITYAALVSIENVIGTQNADTIIGNSGANRLDGQAGADFLDGGNGTDSLYGGAGNDTLSQNFGGPDEVMDGGADTDTGDWSYSVFGVWTIDLAAGTAKLGATTFAQLTSIENAIGGQAGDTIIGTSGENRLDGQNGADVLDGGNGTDSLYGGAGDDTLSQNFGGPDEVMDGGADTDTGDWSYNLFNAWTIDLTAGTAKIGATTYAQLISIENAIGGQAGDTIIGTSGANRLDGQNGADTLDGGGGNDTLSGGAGADSMAGGAGDDLYNVADAGDVVTEAGGSGADTVAASVNWTLGLGLEVLQLQGSATTGTGNNLANTLLGNALNNTLSGGNGNDTLRGEAGDDSLNGGGNADSMAGGAGNDTYIVDDLGDVVTEMLSGGDDGGLDQVRSTVSFTLGAFIETLTLLGTGAINGTGNTLANSITGNGLANTLSGAEGADTLDGGLGPDTLLGGGGNDVLIVNEVGDVVTENPNAGIDLVLSAVAFTLGLNIENLTLTGNGAVAGTGNNLANVINGNQGANTLSGGNSDDTLVGGGGSDALTGGAGADSLVGGIGNERYTVDSTGDVILELLNEGNDSVVSSVSWTLGDNLESLQLTGTAGLTGIGNDLVNRITGNSGGNLLQGMGGNDVLFGLDGADTLQGGAGADQLTGGTGADSFFFAALADGVDRIVDFVSGTDFIVATTAFGGGLAAGALDPARFVSHASASATSAFGVGQFVYHSGLGALYYDADGGGGAAAERFATLSGAPGLAVTDILIA
jgi:Ca2+-binding RTX toxin-like protein/subtilisin-like proprotein convertase family protein